MYLILAANHNYYTVYDARHVTNASNEVMNNVQFIKGQLIPQSMQTNQSRFRQPVSRPRSLSDKPGVLL